MDRYDGRDKFNDSRGRARRTGGLTCMSLCSLNTVLGYLMLYLTFFSLSGVQFLRFVFTRQTC